MTVLSLFPARVAFVNTDGTLTPEAVRALNSVYERLGGAVVSLADPVSVTLNGSPFIYTATSDGYVVVKGGTVTKLEYGRGGFYTDIGSLNSITTVSSGDTFRITYAALPTMTFIQR